MIAVTKNLTINAKIQLAIMVNVILAIIIGEYIVTRFLHLDGYISMMLNLAFNGTIAFFYGRFVARAITRPLRNEINILSEISNGQGDLTKRLEAKTNDETGEISFHFNQFLESLEKIMSKLAGGAASLGASANYFKFIGKTIFDGAQKQQTETEKVVIEIEELSKREHYIAEISKEAEDIAHKTEKQAIKGGAVVEKSINGMKILESNINRISDALGNLKESINTISGIVVSINEIADQTNLLALNAAIEAARAGQNGRGFAVVADEVRALAVRAANSTKKINSLLDNIQSNMSSLITVMDEGTDQVQKEVEYSMHAGESLKEIVAYSKESARQVSCINSNVDEQLKIAVAILEQINAISHIANTNGNTVHQLVKFSSELDVQTDSLQNIVKQFTYTK